jgi:hypothetical protein
MEFIKEFIMVNVSLGCGVFWFWMLAKAVRSACED